MSSRRYLLSDPQPGRLVLIAPPPRGSQTETIVLYQWIAKYADLDDGPWKGK